MAAHGSGFFSFPWLSNFTLGLSSPAMSQPIPPPPPAHHDQHNKDGQGTSTSTSTPTSGLFRHARQFGLFMAGAGLLAASVAVSRRAVIRQRLSMLPPFYASNRNPLVITDGDRQQLAAQALGLATLNVMSFGVLLVGGISWGFDLSSVEELRRRTKVALERPSGLSEEDEKEAEREMAKVMDGFMERLGMKKPEDEAPTDEAPTDESLPKTKTDDEP